MTQLPVSSTVSSKFGYFKTLTRVIYYFDFYWNTRDASWILGIYDAQKNPILCGIKLVPSYFLLEQYRYLSNIPPGDLFVTDTKFDLADSEIAYDGFESRFVLMYAEPGELQ